MDGAVVFTLTDKVTGDANPIGISLRYWQGYELQKGEDTQPSGAYIFRPTENQFESVLYSHVSNIQISKCSAKDSFVVWFTGYAETEGDAIMTITIDDLALLKVDVELFGIP